MRKLLFIVLALALPCWGQTCKTTTIAKVSRVVLQADTTKEFVAGNFSYYTTGVPTVVSITIEAGNELPATQTPFTKIAAVTSTTGADMGSASGAYRYWYANLGTLTAGTSPTIVLTACFGTHAWSRFAWPATGISGGILGFTSPTTLASSVLQTANALIVGGGAGATPTPLALGTANYLLGMNAGGTANAYRATVASAQGGFGASLAAAGAGTYAKSDGATPAVFAASTLAASGVGTPTACTNQFVSGFTLAGDAAPVSTCTSIVAGDLGTAMTPQFARIGLGAAADATDPLNVYNGNALFKYGHVKFTSQVKPGAPTSSAVTDGGACTDGSHVIATTFVTSNGETEYGAVSAAQTCVLGTTKQTIPMSAIPTGIAGVTTGRNMCASKAGTVTPLYQVGASPTIADNSTTTYNFVTADASLTVACNATNTTTSRFYRDGVLMGLANDPNTSWGLYAGQSNTGALFTGVGLGAGQSNTGALFTGVGFYAGQSNTGVNFTGVGSYAGYQNTGVNFTGVGALTGYQNTGVNFTGFGYQAGRYLADGSTGNTTSTYSLFLGAGTKAAAAGETNQIVIGYDTIGAGSNTATLGNTSVVKTVLRGHVGTTQAAVPTLSACGTGTPAMEAGSTDHRGFFTTGAGVLTSCTVTFNIAYAVRPACSVYGDNAVAVVGLNWTTAVGTLVVQATSMTSQTFGYICQ